MAVIFEKLERMRADIQKDKEKVTELLERIKVKEAKLKEAEANQIVADVGALNMSPEQLSEFLALIKSGQISAIMSGSVAASTTSSTYGYSSKDEDEDTDNEDMEDIEDEEN